MSDNKIHIETDALQLTLEGEPRQLEEAYEALRSTIISRLQESVDATSGPTSRDPDSLSGAGARPGRDDPDATSPMFRPDSTTTSVPEATTPDHSPRFIVCNELSRRVAPLKKREFDESILAAIVDYTTVQTVYTNEETAEMLADEIGFGETLWRELTSEGLAAISDVDTPS